MFRVNQHYQPSDEFAELLQSVVDGELTEEEHRCLEELLGSDPEARVFFATFMQIHATLSHEAIGFSTERDDSAVVLNREAARSRFPHGFRQFSFWTLTASLMAVLALPYLIPPADRTVADNEPVKRNRKIVESSQVNFVERPPAPIATLATHVNASWEGAALSVGQPLYESESISLKQGSARISVGFGAEIAMEGRCQITFLARDRVRLDRGTVVVDVATWAKGFTVVTEDMDVVDMGTTFSVSNAPNSAVETKVLSGLVRAIPAKTRTDQQRSVLLSEGQGLFVDKQGNRRSFAQIPTQTLTKLDFGKLAQYRPVELYSTGYGLSEGDQDQHWRVVAGPDGRFKEPQYARVCVPHFRYLPNDPEQSQWVSILDWENAAPSSTYTFQTTFQLTGYDLSTMRIFGRFLADNGVQELRVNGRSVPIESWTDNKIYQRFKQSQFRIVNITDGLHQGENVIEIDVWNGIANGEYNTPASPNHMSLRAEWYAFGRQSSVDDKRDASR